MKVVTGFRATKDRMCGRWQRPFKRKGYIRGELEEAKRVHAEGMTKLDAVTNRTPEYDKPERWMKAVGEKIAGQPDPVKQ